MKLTSIIFSHSSSRISSNGRGSKMPRLLTRIATSGKRSVASSTPSGGAEVGGERLQLRRGMGWAMAATASATRASVRPLTMTRAPSAASALAMARPMPAVEPVTSASLSVSCRSMAFSPATRVGGPF